MIYLTESAKEHIRAMIAKRGQGIGIRLSAKAAGCAGYRYVLDYADTIDGDEVAFGDEIQVVVPTDALDLLEGVVVDYVREGLAEQFTFQHPRASASCGCGESFSV
jgi:iron-sulfur cluster assembly protein